MNIQNTSKFKGLKLEDCTNFQNEMLIVFRLIVK